MGSTAINNVVVVYNEKENHPLPCLIYALILHMGAHAKNKCSTIRRHPDREVGPALPSA
jgi:hypothetical protein